MIIKSDQALTLIVDNQVRLLPSIADSEQMLQNTRTLLSGLKLLKIPMIITQQYTQGLGMSEESMFVTSGVTNYMDKITFSCWKDEAIQKKILSSGSTQIVLCGIETHICVLQTALDLLEAGYEVILVEDCVSSRKLSDKITAINRMRQAGVTITSYESLLFEFMVSAHHPQFKDVQKLIK